MKLEKKEKKNRKKKKKKEMKRRRNVPVIRVRNYYIDSILLHLFTSCGQFAKSSPRALIAEMKKNLNSVGIPSYSIPF